MKKKILSVFFCALLAGSMFLMTACEKETPAERMVVLKVLCKVQKCSF